MADQTLTAQIEQWDRSTCLAENIAADLAIGIRSARLSSLPSSRSIAIEWDVSPRTVRRAKRLLAETDLIKKDRRTYYLSR